MIKHDAGEIFAKYLGKDAVCSVGIVDAIRDSTIERICCADGSIDIDCFADAQRFVYNILENRYDTFYDIYIYLFLDILWNFSKASTIVSIN